MRLFDINITVFKIYLYYYRFIIKLNYKAFLRLMRLFLISVEFRCNYVLYAKGDESIDLYSLVMINNLDFIKI